METARKAATRAAVKKRAAVRSPEATQLLEADRAEVRQLFGQYQQLVDEVAGGDDRQALAEQICTTLIVHATIEEKIFYPAARKASDEHDLLDKAEVEHELARALIAQIVAMDADEALYDARVKVLGDYVDHHVRQEQGELVPRCPGCQELLDGGDVWEAQRQPGWASPMQRAPDNPHNTTRISMDALTFPTAEQAAIVDAAIVSRRSIRAFLPTPVLRETIEQILAVASRAPSGTNTQPWNVVVLTGEAKTGLSRKLLAAYDDPEEAMTHKEEYAYYPTEWRSPFIDRRRKIGWDLYGLLRIAKTDKSRMHDQHGRNYTFFDAPVGLMFTIDRIMGQGSWLDFGMFLQNVMIAARARGLDTCPQAAFTRFHRVVMEHIGAPSQQMLVCGMSLGYADASAVENGLVTDREPVAGFTRFLE